MNNEADPIEAYRQRTRAVVERLKAKLNHWICEHGGEDLFCDLSHQPASPAHHATEVTSVLLETGIDREIHLLGEQDARDMVMRVFERRAKVARRRFQ